MAMPLTAYRFTVDEYHRMGQAGILRQDDRVELIHGQVVRMSPIGVDHAACVNRLTRLLTTTLASRATVSVQNPVILDDHQEPQPDVALLHFRLDGYAVSHPRATDVLLLVEVADTTLDYDRNTKIPLYAEAGIPEAWLVNLPDDVIEVYRTPAAGQYRDLRTARRGETVSPLAFPDLAIQVEEILGPNQP